MALKEHMRNVSKQELEAFRKIEKRNKKYEKEAEHDKKKQLENMSKLQVEEIKLLKEEMKLDGLVKEKEEVKYLIM